jgi:SagB-type dehydrogenase family enzyme
MNNQRWIFCLSLWGFFLMVQTVSGKTIQLPSPDREGSMSVEKAISDRRSIRQYTTDPLSLETVSQTMWACQGITHDGWGRAAPSAGATYPLEIYLVVNRVEGLKPGLYHYLIQTHALKILKIQDLGQALSDAALGQSMIREAAFNIIIAADYERTATRYGSRAQRYVHIEVGHVGQNIYLQTEALGLGTVAVGAFDDQKVQHLLGIEEAVLYLMPVGKPAQ